MAATKYASPPLRNQPAKSPILSQFSDLEKPQLHHLTIESCILERGSRFKEYSDLRDRKLRMKHLEEQTPERVQNRLVLASPKRQVNSGVDSTTPLRRSKGCFSFAQTVSDFSPPLRKENRSAAQSPPCKSERGSTVRKSHARSQRF